MERRRWDDRGTELYHKTLPTEPSSFEAAVSAYREDLVVAVECVFSWYWIADLLRRRMHFVGKQAELPAHIQNTNTQYNLPPFAGRISRKVHRKDLGEHFPDPVVRACIDADVELLDVYYGLIVRLEAGILKAAKLADPVALTLLQSIPGFGKTLSLVIIYEVDDINRFPAEGNFVSYCRLVRPAHESAGKKKGSKNSKIGNARLKWAFSEAACLFLKGNERAQKYHEKLVSWYGKPKALTLLARKLGRTVYTMLREEAAIRS